MTTLKKLNELVESKRLAFIETKDKALKEKILKELEEVKNQFELDNLEDIKDELKLHRYVKDACSKVMTSLMDKNADAFEIKEIYGNLMSAKAMISNYENAIEQNKKAITQLAAALKGSMNQPKTEMKKS